MPVTVVKRIPKGAPLTAAEHDQNLTNIKTAIDANELALTSKIGTSEKGAANGVATLDGSTLVPLAQIPVLPTAKIEAKAITFDKVQDIATDTLLGRSTAGVGPVETVPVTPAGRALIAAANALDQRALLGVSEQGPSQKAFAWITFRGDLPVLTISSFSFVGVTITANAAAHGLTVGSSITFSGQTGTNAVLNGVWYIHTINSSSQFVFDIVSPPVSLSGTNGQPVQIRTSYNVATVGRLNDSYYTIKFTNPSVAPFMAMAGTATFGQQLCLTHRRDLCVDAEALGDVRESISSTRAYVTTPDAAFLISLVFFNSG